MIQIHDIFAMCRHAAQAVQPQVPESNVMIDLCVMVRGYIWDMGTGECVGVSSSIFKRTATLAVMMLLIVCAAAAGERTDDDWMAAVAVISGATSPEELDEYTVEQFSVLKARPLRINLVSRSRLSSSGLFSPYQVASLSDYISRHGDILSLAELAAVDGFGKEYAAALEHFISLDSSALPGRSSDRTIEVYNSLTLRSGFRKKADEDSDCSYAMKYVMEAGDRGEIGLVAKSGYDAGYFPPEVMSFYAAFYGRSRLGKVIAGDFNARFGQGLGLWSGFTMGGLASPASFTKRASGISPYRSYSGEGSLRGLASDFSAGRFTISSFIAADGLRELMSGQDPDGISLLSGLNIGYLGHNFQGSVTCFAQTEDVFYAGSSVSSPRTDMAATVCWQDQFADLKCSGDFRYNCKGTDIFAEAAFDFLSMSAAAVGGARFRIGDAVDMAVAARYYPASYNAGRSGAVRSGSRCSNEYGISACCSFASGGYVKLAGKEGFGSSSIVHAGNVSMDVFYSPAPRYGAEVPGTQMKFMADYRWQTSPSVALCFRVSERLRTWDRTSKTDLRTDVRYSDGTFCFASRINAVVSEALGLLGYIEGGYLSGIFTVYLRGGLFRADNWDDRIYVYERDAPGNFNVPAYYGRGYWTALTAGIKVKRWLRAYLRASFQDCPWLQPGMTQKKPGKAELKVQVVFQL